MIRVLITGANSYIGVSLERWLSHDVQEYSVDTIDMLNADWKNKSFSDYDCVFHVAGIAHVDTKSVSGDAKELYYRVNKDLTIETARKAKRDGVKQFIFMSSIIVYGENNKQYITAHTIPAPSGFYGDSKLQAEKGLMSLETDAFKIVILRPPMIYGKGSKGNYRKLSKLACKIPIFPKINNARSMLYIEHLCEFIRLMIKNKESGIFFPQNETYVCTSSMVKQIATINGKAMLVSSLFNPLISLCPKAIKGKVFGTLAYEQDISTYKEKYNIYSFEETIGFTEEKE